MRNKPSAKVTRWPRYYDMCFLLLINHWINTVHVRSPLVRTPEFRASVVFCVAKLVLIISSSSPPFIISSNHDIISCRIENDGPVIAKHFCPTGEKQSLGPHRNLTQILHINIHLFLLLQSGNPHFNLLVTPQQFHIALPNFLEKVKFRRQCGQTRPDKKGAQP
jgi:hypothetical protein